MQRRPLPLILALLLLAPAPARAAHDFFTFESAPVRPLALSAAGACPLAAPPGTCLFAANTPDNRLEIFEVGGGGLSHLHSVPVGMEPVAVAIAPDGKVWVVNHLSDSVSLVDVASAPPRVVRTLLVGDEPNDIVFAGPGRSRAFVSSAARGQETSRQGVHPYDYYEQEGVGRADVWVFDAANPGAGLGGTPLSVITLFGDKPRALAASNDGSRVYAAVFHSGNRTTAVIEGLVCDGGAGAPSCSVNGSTMPGGLPSPNRNHQNTLGPEVGLVVRFDAASGQWRDELNRNWNNAVRFSLPDKDVFEIDANASPPAAVKTGPNPEDDRACAGVGTVLFNLVAKPGSNLLYASNTEARNEVRFEGPGASFSKPSGHPDSVRGHLHEARISVLDPSQPTCSVTPRHLNKHIVYGPGPATFASGTSKADSLATPLDMAVSSDGSTLYVAAFGSAKVGVFASAALESDAFVPDTSSHIAVPGGGPAGLALDETNNRLYVLTRFDNSVVTIDLGSRLPLDQDPLFNPEPAQVVSGRPFLYDASLTSSNGEASCSSCHVFADMDDLTWDLGDPDGDVVPFNANPDGPIGGDQAIHPMKGPMTTQTLRGLANHGPMHWRGDRTGAAPGPPDDPVGGLNEDLAFKAFNVAFFGLLGRDEGPLTNAQMQAFTDFILEVVSPPNPIRQLGNSLRADEQAGLNLYNGRNTDGVANCNGCHTLNPAAGFFGTGGLTTFEGETQEFKVAHLRNAYQKVGMFGMANLSPFIEAGNNGHQGPQIRGAGFLHDGSIDTVFRFLSAGVFSLSTTEQRNLEAFIMAFDTTLAPIVGQQVTLTSANSPGDAVNQRIDLLIQRALTSFALLGHPGARECDLVVKGVVGGQPRGAVMLASGPNAGLFQSDAAGDPLLSDAQVRSLAVTPGQELTYTCAPPGSGARMGIDRDRDGTPDADEGTPPPVCGNGVTEPPEQCDDGNTVSGDGCSATCQDEFCGDGVVQAGLGEQCDDGNTVSGDGCSATCQNEPPPPVCGNGVTEPPEQCDDGNTVSGDGCSATCQNEPPPAGMELIAGRKLVMRDKDGDASRRRLVLLSIDPAILPTPAGDPRLAGATLRLFNAATGEQTAIDLPAANWSGLGKPPGVRGFRFRDPGGTCSTVILKPGKLLRAVCRGSGLGFSLDEPAQGSLAVTVQSGSDPGFCMEFGGRVTKDTPAENGRSGVFSAVDAPPPASCPAP